MFPLEKSDCSEHAFPVRLLLLLLLNPFIDRILLEISQASLSLSSFFFFSSSSSSSPPFFFQLNSMKKVKMAEHLCMGCTLSQKYPNVSSSNQKGLPSWNSTHWISSFQPCPEVAITQVSNPRAPLVYRDASHSDSFPLKLESKWEGRREREKEREKEGEGTLK